MQLSFDSNVVADALGEEPSEVIVFQHAGGERASWEDGKVQKEGTHPVVYPAAGSHATFYDSAVYLGNGQNGSGVGCDNTSEPLRELRLAPVLLPETAPEDGAFQWLSYRGRWDEREKGCNNGPNRAGDEDGLARTWLIAFPIVGGVSLLAEALASGRGVDHTAGRAGVHLAFADLAETFGRPVAEALVAAVVIVFIRELCRGRRIGFLDTVRGALARFGRVVAAQLLAILALLLMAVTVIGLPFAIWKHVSWLFVQQEVHPVRDRGPDAPLLRPRSARRGGTGEDAAAASAVARTPTRSRGSLVRL